jgi:hypothetical protein
MFWMTLYVIGFVVCVWTLVCLTVYGALKGEVPEDSWHWKWYVSLYKTSSQTECQYVLKLFFVPFLWVLIIIFVVIVTVISSAGCLLKDWVIVPLLCSQRVARVNRAYLKGVFGQDDRLMHYRYPVEYVAFLPFSVEKMVRSPKFLPVLTGASLSVFAVLAALTMYQYYHQLQVIPVQQQYGVVFLVILCGSVMAFGIHLLYKHRNVIEAGWRKFKDAHCHLLKTPMDTVCETMPYVPDGQDDFE